MKDKTRYTKAKGTRMSREPESHTLRPSKNATMNKAESSDKPLFIVILFVKLSEGFYMAHHI